MKIYNVYVDPNEAEPLEGAVFVKEGFSFAAAVMSFFWALYHRMWVVGAALFVVQMVLSLVDKKQILHADAVTILTTGLMVFVGYSANDWYGRNLSGRGKILFDVVSGKNKSDAERRFFAAYVQDRQA